MARFLTAALIAAAAFAFVPHAALAQGQSKGPPGLPEGKGKTEVEAICAGCHVTGLIPASLGYTRDHWKQLIATMIDLSPSPDTQNAILDYLSTNFPPNERRKPKLMPGNFDVKFTEWVMPQLGSRVRDPMQHEDGSIWYAGQYGNLLGRFDPRTGQAKEWQLPANAKPHTVQLDNKGRPWYSGNKNGTVGRLDPATGQTTVYKMPDPKSDPHTLAFNKDGILFFSFQAANLIGRLNPETGDLKVVSAPNPKSQPYDVRIAPDGTVWVSCNARGCFLKVNPDTMEVTEIPFPAGGSTRRFIIAEDGMIWYNNSNRGRIGRFNPKTNEFKEWPSPSGPTSHPYGAAWLGGAYWYNESGMRPDPLVRFDPATETFQSWAIPSGNIYAGILRNARTTREGNLLIHQTATNRILQVTPQRRAASAQ
jgi:virginiamycin B lyase